MKAITKAWWWWMTSGSAIPENGLITYDNTALTTYGGTNLTSY